MAIKVQCEKCGSVMNIRETYAGTERTCPKCGKKFRVPEASEAATTDEAKADSVAPTPSKVDTPKGSTPKEERGQKAPGASTAPKEAEAPAAEEEFDAIAFLTGEKPASQTDKSSKAASKSSTKLGAAGKGKGTSTSKDAGSREAKTAKGTASSPRQADDEFDPLDILSEGKPQPSTPAAAKSSDTGKPPVKPPQADTAASRESPTTPAEEEFDPLAVLGEGPIAKAPPPAASPSTKSAAPPKDEAPDEKPDAAAETPAAAEADAPQEPEPYKPKRPSWAKPLPDEKPEPDAPAATAADTPQEAEPYKPRRPSWAKPLPGEEASPPAKSGRAQSGADASALTAVAADASPAAMAAAAAMGGQIQAQLPPEPEAVPRRPLFDKAAFAAGIKRRVRLIAVTIPTALVLFGISWLFAKPGHVVVPELIPVAGQVTLDGKPLAGARVLYHPRSNQFRSPSAITDSDGRYRLEYWKGQPGAPVARYRVQVELINKAGRDTIPLRFGQVTRHEITVRDRSTSYDIAITTK